MSDKQWFELGEESKFLPDSSVEIVVEDRIVAVCHTDGQLYALDGVCPHQGGPLGQGDVHDCILTCPWHGWQFDVRDGQSLLSPHVRHPTLPLKVESGKVWVQLSRQTP